MNRKIRLCHAISYGILFWLAAAVFLLGHCRILDRDRTVAGREVPAGTQEVRLDRQVQQVFIAEGDYLRYLEVYTTTENANRKWFYLYVYDENNEILINREIATPDVKLPGFLRIPLGIRTQPGRAYVWQLKGTDTPMELVYENTGETGLVTFGNGYVIENGETQMMEAQNFLMRLIYTDSPSAGKMAALYAGLFLLAAILIAVTEYLGLKMRKLDQRVRVGHAVCLTAGPALLAFAAWLLYAVFVRDLFGGKPEDKAVYTAGICLALLWAGWALLGKRSARHTKPFRELLSERGMDWLQSAAYAGVLMGTIHFMNAQYQIWQDLAYREVLFWMCLVLLTMGPVRAYANRWGALWGALSGAAGLAFYLFRRAGVADEEAVLKLSLLRYEILIAVAAGFVGLALADRLQNRRFAWDRVNRPYAVSLAALLALLAAFRNTRGWPLYLAAVFGLFYLFYLSWERRERLTANFCGGIVLNFALAAVFALARRPFRAWMYPRYNFVFHTVTITAYYLTLVICALTVLLLQKMNRERKSRLADCAGTLLLYGMAMSFLFFTLSRTGYLAVIAMTALLAPLLVFGVYRTGPAALVKSLACMAAAVLLCLPLTYTGIRLLPAVYNDPYIYEVEDTPAAIHRDDPKDSTAYMSVSYFLYVMENKLLSGETEEKTAFLEPLLSPGGGPYVLPGTVLVASEDLMSGLEEYSNGRMDIFRRYMDAWNLTGHDTMGVELPDGSLSVHAHNTYLQVIHDHGLAVGVLFIGFGAFSALLMCLYAVRCRRVSCAALPLAVLAGFAVAGLVEWLFHPCNPMGFSLMTVLAPLLCFRPGKAGDAGRRAG